VHVTQGEIEIIDSVFTGQDSSFLFEEVYQSKYSVNGALIAAYDYSVVTIDNSEFADGRGTYGGCMVLLGQSVATITGESSFTNCAA
jgi:hypothetical protein